LIAGGGFVFLIVLAISWALIRSFRLRSESDATEDHDNSDEPETDW
jgi:hypothetical protein